MILAASVAEDVFRGILQGTPPGAVYALIALGFVLTYKTSGVFNLAFGAQAYVSAAMYFQAREEWGWATVPALVVSVFVLAPAIGLVLERLIFRPLRTASAVAKLVVTIGLSVALPALFELITDFQPVAGQTPEGIVPDGASVFYDPFGVYAFSRNELVAPGVAVLGMLGLAALFRFTALGLAMRALVESARMTELAGIRSDRVSAFAWALSSVFAGMAGVLIAPRFNTLVAADFFNLVVVAIAAAALGRLVSLPRALAGGFALGIFIALLNTFLPRWSADRAWLQAIQENLTPAVPFVVLFAVLVLWPAIRRTREAADPLSGVDPPPPSLAAATRSPRLTLFTRLFALGFFLIVGLVVFFRADDSWLFLVTQAVILATIYLSITVITGFAGQISLCQGAFAATGGFTVFQLADRYDMSVLVAAFLGAAAAAAAGALLSLPVLRLGGIWFAIATLAFAFFFDSVMVKLSWVGGGDTSLLEGTRVPRPTIGPWDFANDLSFLALAVVVFVLVALAVIRIREGTVGRTLRALRGSEVAAASIGISPARARIVAFAVSAFIAGLGGAMLSMHQENVNYTSNFAPFAAAFWLVLVVALGSRTVEGAAHRPPPSRPPRSPSPRPWSRCDGIRRHRPRSHRCHQALRRHRRPRRRQPAGRHRRADGAHRAQRRREDDVLQLRPGAAAAGSRAGAARGPGHQRPAGARPAPSRRDRPLRRGARAARPRGPGRRAHRAPQPRQGPAGGGGPRPHDRSQAAAARRAVVGPRPGRDRRAGAYAPGGAGHPRLRHPPGRARRRAGVMTEGATAPAAPAVLDLRGVTAAYGPFRALFGVDLTIGPGEAVALLGANGAGKTTVARVATGLVAPTDGSVLVGGDDFTGAGTYRFVRAGVAHAPEGRSVFATLSVGEQRMLSMARVLVESPSVLVADELSLGLAPKVVDDVYESLARLREQGSALLIVEQHA